LTGTPVVLVISPKGSSLNLAAQLWGLLDFRPESAIAALILADCPEKRAASLAPVLTRETGLPVLGFLPPMPEARFESRHLGLLTAQEIADLDGRISLLARALEENADLPRLLALFDGPAPESEAVPAAAPPLCRIAVARDEAFCFCYAETLETLSALGAEPVFFSPLHDAALPEHIGGLYLPGGYPELHAARLSENIPMRTAVARAVQGGLPTVAECGGYLYLTEALFSPEGKRFPMAAVLPGEAKNTGGLRRFGYAELLAQEDSLLFRAGERFPVHAFHYWDASVSGSAFRLEKPLSGRSWCEGCAGKNLYAAFPHLYFAGAPLLAERFVRAAMEYGAKHGTA
jgi:cobyrinic acid a,c-diamide synthase